MSSLLPARSARRSLSLAAATLLVVLTAGCSDDDTSAEDPVPTSPGDASTTTSGAPDPSSDAPDAPDAPDVDPAAFCSLITDDDLAAITGRAQSVSDGTGSGYRTSCNSVRDVEDGLGIGWTRLGPPARLASQQDAAGSLLEPVQQEVAGSTDARVFAGEIAGTPIVRVVTSYDGAVLEVEATDDSATLGTDPVPQEELIAAAVGVAEAYLA